MICGAAKPNVNAVTPPLTNCRRENFMAWSALSTPSAALIELVFAGADDQPRQPGNLLLQLRIAAGPGRGAEVIGHRRLRATVEAHRLEPRLHVLEHAIGTGTVRLRVTRQV